MFNRHLPNKVINNIVITTLVIFFCLVTAIETYASPNNEQKIKLIAGLYREVLMGELSVDQKINRLEKIRTLSGSSIERIDRMVLKLYNETEQLTPAIKIMHEYEQQHGIQNNTSNFSEFKKVQASVNNKIDQYLSNRWNYAAKNLGKRCYNEDEIIFTNEKVNFDFQDEDQWMKDGRKRFGCIEEGVKEIIVKNSLYEFDRLLIGSRGPVFSVKKVILPATKKQSWKSDLLRNNLDIYYYLPNAQLEFAE